jgi:outer membrane protein assembly factor BamB
MVCKSIMVWAILIGQAALCSAQPPIRWPQFHGVDGSGLAADGTKVPRDFGPDQNVLWKTPLPRGHSSPCIWDDRIYLTGCEKGSKELETLCLDRATGKILWRRSVQAEQTDPLYELNNPASSTPATDGERVFVYFGMFGLVCYDRDGGELWRRPFAPIPGRFGSGQSPVVADGIVLLNTGTNNLIYNTTAFDAKTGKTIWEKGRPRGFSQGLWSTPAVRKVDGGYEVLVLGGARLCAYNLADGAERWHVAGLPLVSMNTPVVSNGVAVLTLSNPIGDRENVVMLPTFDDALKKYDKNGDGKIQLDEIPADLMGFTRGREDKIGDWMPVRGWARQFDQNRDGALDRDEWNALLAQQTAMADSAVTTTYCLRLDGPDGDRVLWSQTKSAPEVPSPLVYDGRAYLVSERGFITCRELKSGKELYRERFNTRGTCYASPVGGDGIVIAASDGGTVIILKAGDKFEPIARVQFPEGILATPALVDGKTYLRTVGRLYAFAPR